MADGEQQTGITACSVFAGEVVPETHKHDACIFSERTRRFVPSLAAQISRAYFNFDNRAVLNGRTMAHILAALALEFYALMWKDAKPRDNRLILKCNKKSFQYVSHQYCRQRHAKMIFVETQSLDIQNPNVRCAPQNVTSYSAFIA